jgi:hypothetical protein
MFYLNPAAYKMLWIFYGPQCLFTMTLINVNFMVERKTNLMHLLYIFIVAVGDALHVSAMFAHRQER